MNSEPKNVRLPLMVTQAEAIAIDDWRFANKIPTRAEPVRRSIKAGLDAADKIPIRGRKPTSDDTCSGEDDAGKSSTSPSRPKRTSPPRTETVRLRRNRGSGRCARRARG